MRRGERVRYARHESRPAGHRRRRAYQRDRAMGISIVTTAEPATIVTRTQRARRSMMMRSISVLLSAIGVKCFRGELAAASWKPGERLLWLEPSGVRGERVRAARRRRTAGGRSRDGISYEGKGLDRWDPGMVATLADQVERRSQLRRQVIDSRILRVRALSAIN
jgi:hypothetical protein